MEEETLKMYIKGVLNRFAFLQLTGAQAERIVHFEEEEKLKISGDPKWRDSMSVWEESEYRLDKFQKILDDGQFMLFENSEKEGLKRHEEEARNSDAGEANMLAYTEAYLDWLKKEYVPAIRREALQAFIAFFTERVKIDYMRAEYRAYLKRQHDKAIINHYRYSRRLQPNGLRLALLWWERMKLLPDYRSFVWGSDEPTRAVGEFLLETYVGVCPRAGDLVRTKKEELEEAGRRLRMQYLGEPEIRGWHTEIIPRSRETEDQAALMMLMLME
jgi:hypothetical protein